MVENPDPNISFAFRVECNDTSCVGTRTFDPASDSETRCVHETATKDAEDSTKKVLIIRSRKYKVIQFVIRRITRRRKKRSDKQRKSVKGVSVKTGKQTTEAQVKTEQDDANMTFATQDLSIDADSDSPLLDESPSMKQRKRFAGIWEEFEIARQIKAEQARSEKRARTKSLGQWEEFKENVGPEQSNK